MKAIPYSRQSITKSDIDEVVKVLRSDFITTGPKIQGFEKRIADYSNAKYAVVFNSGTSALHASYFASGIKIGDEIITSPLTFVATSNAALYLGARPIFADIDKNTGNIDISQVEKLITPKTKLVVPVHFGGKPADMKSLKKLSKKYKFGIVDDASHALGAKIGKSIVGDGTYSDMTTFSFHPVKHITTGEGGAVVTNNIEYFQKLLLFRSHGITKDKQLFKNFTHGSWYYEMHTLGFNYRMTDFQAALGISQLKKLNNFIKKRQEIAKIYKEAFSDSTHFTLPDTIDSVYHLFPILLSNKLKIKKQQIFSLLQKNNLLVQTHYIPVHLQPYYQNLGYKKSLCPRSIDFYEREISIPIFPSMSKKEISYTIKTILKVIENV